MRFISFIKSSYEELTQKVTWSSYESLQQSTIVIAITSIIISLIIWLMDSGANLIFKGLYNIFR